MGYLWYVLGSYMMTALFANGSLIDGNVPDVRTICRYLSRKFPLV